MTNCVDASVLETLTELERALTSTPPSSDAVAAIQRQLADFDAAAAAETVIESYYGCLVTEHLRRRFDIAPAALPAIVNTSHRAVRRVCVVPGEHLHGKVLEKLWAGGWRTFRKHAGVDMGVQTDDREESLRRADLYVLAAGQIISLEYKYVGPKGLARPEECVAQMGPYLAAHAATRLVVYSGTPSGTPVRGWDTLGRLLPAGVPLLLYGPPIVPVGRPGRRPGH